MGNETKAVSELMPLSDCPFCGSDARYQEDDSAASGGYNYWILCGECGASSDYYETPENAAESWNLRPVQASEARGDWYTDESTGSHIVDFDANPKRQLSLMLKRDGSVAWAVYNDGGKWHGDNAVSCFATILDKLAAHTQAGPAQAEAECTHARWRQEKDGSVTCANCNAEVLPKVTRWDTQAGPVG